MEPIDLVMKLLAERNREQKELADYLGISQQRFSDWKAGRAKSYMKHIILITS